MADSEPKGTDSRRSPSIEKVLSHHEPPGALEAAEATFDLSAAGPAADARIGEAGRAERSQQAKARDRAAERAKRKRSQARKDRARNRKRGR